MHPILQLVRPLNVAIVFLTIVVAGILGKAEDWDIVWIIVGGLAGALIAAGGNAINDVFDVKEDSINRPDRPIPRGAVTAEEARKVWMITSGVGLALSVPLGFWNIFISVLWVVGLYYYSKELKGMMLVGNFAVAFMTGLAFPFGALIAGRPILGVYPALFAFLANLARELVKDVEDVNGDATANRETLAVVHGTGAGLLGATIALGILILLTFLPVIVGLYNFTYLLFVLIVDLGLGFVGLSFWYDATHSNLRRLSLILKACMVLGLFAIFVGS
jgi:geranylgeranylglycerol-phosphate geranylgeranyltransferase